MKYEVTLTMTFESSSDADRIAKQTESGFEFGTVSEAITEGLKLNEAPHLVDVSVRSLAGNMHDDPATQPCTSRAREAAHRRFALQVECSTTACPLNWRARLSRAAGAILS